MERRRVESRKREKPPSAGVVLLPRVRAVRGAMEGRRSINERILPARWSFLK
jgi:hypothetical protein